MTFVFVERMAGITHRQPGRFGRSPRERRCRPPSAGAADALACLRAAAALRRLRDAPDEELAVFEDKLRDDALEAGATEQEIREAQRNHPEHGE